jgi:hypothetical protein
MSDAVEPQRIAILWQLAFHDTALACVVYRDAEGMELRVESDAAVIVRERFDLQPRALARAQGLRESLKRRGWQEAPHGVPSTESGGAPVV